MDSNNPTSPLQSVLLQIRNSLYPSLDEGVRFQHLVVAKLWRCLVTDGYHPKHSAGGCPVHKAIQVEIPHASFAQLSLKLSPDSVNPNTFRQLEARPYVLAVIQTSYLTIVASVAYWLATI